MKSTMFVVAAAIAVSTPAVSQQLDVPAFFAYRRSDGTINADWSRIEAAGQTVRIVVSDRTALVAAYAADTSAEFDKLRAPPNYQLVLGYVDTQHGSRLPLYVFGGGDPVLPPNPTSVTDCTTIMAVISTASSSTMDPTTLLTMAIYKDTTTLFSRR